MVSLTHDLPGAFGNRDIRENVTNNGFVVQGMSGGGGYDCAENVACLQDADCAPGLYCEAASGTCRPVTFDLTVTPAGTGSGQVLSDPPGIDCGVDCTAAFPQDGAVTLTATADAGSTFDGWSGGGCSGTADCTVTMSAAQSVTATFTRITHALDVTKSGAGGGTVTSSPAGLDCGPTCSADFGEGTVVTLTPAADAGSTFVEWTGDCAGPGTCQVTMDAAHSVGAVFDAAGYVLDVTTSGAGAGTVTADVGAIDCGATCSDTYAAGTTVTLTATPDTATTSTFVAWTGACTGADAVCTVTMDAAKAVDAEFGP